MNTGLIVEVYKSKRIGDCTNGGISGKNENLLLVLPEGGPFSMEDHKDIPAVYLDERNEISRILKGDCVIAVPFGHASDEFCFGGNFIYTSDSRFPSSSPIPIHDRPLYSDKDF